MSKRLRDKPIYLAPEILGSRDVHNNPLIQDERTGTILNPYDINDKILIYKRQVEGWFLNPATRLCHRKNNNFVVVMIATSYIEGVEQYRKGNLSNGQSRQYFTEGMKRIFKMQSIADSQISILYKHLRCGLFHNGMSGDAVVLNRTLKSAVNFSNPEIIAINPILFLDAVTKDFEQYVNELWDEDNTELRNNFDSMFTVL